MEKYSEAAGPGALDVFTEKVKRARKLKRARNTLYTVHGLLVSEDIDTNIYPLADLIGDRHQLVAKELIKEAAARLDHSDTIRLLASAL